MRILLTGANGFIGGHLQRALLNHGHEVVACSRHGKGLDPRSQYQACDFSQDHNVAVWRPRLEGIDVVINCVGIIQESHRQSFLALHEQAPQALFHACELAGIKQVIQLSALGSDKDARSSYHLSKRHADQILMASKLNWLILRPSIVHGPGAHSSSLFRALAALPVVPLVGKGQQPLQPIHIDDLVRAVVYAVENCHPQREIIDCAGSETLSLRQLLGSWKSWLGMGKLHTITLPYRLALMMAGLGSLLGIAALNRDSIAMLQRGSCARVQTFIDAFDFVPNGFTSVIDTQTSTQAERWHARLYLLHPMLRLSLGLLWLWTGVTSALFYPAEKSYELLAAVGIGGLLAPIALYSAALLDTLLGLALLIAWRVRTVATIQLVMIIAYTALISVALSEQWLHPYGPVSKNLPLIVATLMLIAMEDPR